MNEQSAVRLCSIGKVVIFKGAKSPCFQESEEPVEKAEGEGHSEGEAAPQSSQA